MILMIGLITFIDNLKYDINDWVNCYTNKLVLSLWLQCCWIFAQKLTTTEMHNCSWISWHKIIHMFDQLYIITAMRVNIS